jgi:hypothetical protein
MTKKKMGTFRDKWVLTSVNLTNFANFWKKICQFFYMAKWNEKSQTCLDLTCPN